MSRNQLKFFTGGVVVTAAMAVLFAVSFQGNMAYYVEVSDYLAAPPDGPQRNTRIRGTVVHGSIVKTPGELGAAFEMTDGTDTRSSTLPKRAMEWDRVLPGQAGSPAWS